MLATQLPRETAVSGDARDNLVICGTRSLTRLLRGAYLGFFTDDFRFAGCWSKPNLYLQALLHCELQACVEPDFSLYLGDPFAEQLHAVYRSRWVARHWQQHGIRVIPSLNWSDVRSLQFSLCGIPHKPPCVAMEMRPRSKNVHWLIECAKRAIDIVQPLHVLLYGGRDLPLDRLPSGPAYRIVEAWSPRLRQRAA